MKAHERKSLIEKVALRWHKEGIKRLETVGYFKKDSPFFYFRINEPLPEENFITITELFGHNTLTPEVASPMYFIGMRRMLRGDYEGLKEIRLQGINEFNYKPYETKTPGIGKHKTTTIFTAHSTMEPKKEDFEIFDNALLYLDHITEFTNPNSFHLDCYGEEFYAPINNL